MQRTVWLLLCLVGIHAAFAAKTTNWKLSTEGFGPIHIGMDLKAASKAAGKAFTQLKPDKMHGEDEDCFTTTLKTGQMDNVSFMVSDKIIVRININGKGITTTKGAAVGDSETHVKNLYHHLLQSETRDEDEKGNYLTYINPDTDRAIRFETDGKKITRIYAGNNHEVHYEEDCL